MTNHLSVIPSEIEESGREIGGHSTGPSTPLRSAQDDNRHSSFDIRHFSHITIPPSTQSTCPVT